MFRKKLGKYKNINEKNRYLTKNLIGIKKIKKEEKKDILIIISFYLILKYKLIYLT
jgi:hypothetical protein